MSKICAIGERKVVLGAICEKREATMLCRGCYAREGGNGCRLPGVRTETSIEDGGPECKNTIWVKVADATPAQLAAAWARQALAALPALPAIEPGDAMDRVERTREDVANLLTVLAAEMDAEGGVA